MAESGGSGCPVPDTEGRPACLLASFGMHSRHLDRALRALELHGILLQTDARLPNVCGVVAGARISGSWWGHPLAHTIFQVSSALAEHRDVVVTRLVSAKVTYVHRDLWPALVGVATAREPWQLETLSPEARSLLNRVARDGEMQAAGPAARELENKLLVRSEQIHTPTGAHAKILCTWERWAVGAGLPRKRMTPRQAREALERSVAALNRRFEANGRLPWVHE